MFKGFLISIKDITIRKGFLFCLTGIQKGKVLVLKPVQNFVCAFFIFDPANFDKTLLQLVSKRGFPVLRADSL